MHDNLILKIWRFKKNLKTLTSNFLSKFDFLMHNVSELRDFNLKIYSGNSGWKFKSMSPLISSEPFQISHLYLFVVEFNLLRSISETKTSFIKNLFNFT